MAQSRTFLRNTSVRRFFVTIPGLVLCLCAPPDARADDSGHSQDREVRFTGPLVSSSPPLPKGLFNIEPYLINTQVVGAYDGDGDRHDVDGVPDSWTLAVPMQYGLTERLSVGATLTAGLVRTVDADRQWETGDTGLSLSYLLARSDAHNAALTFALKQNVTTGRHDRLERHNLAEATGSGAPTTQLGLYGQAYFLPERTLRGRINVSWRLPGAKASLHGESAYGTSAGYSGRVELKSASQTSLGLEYSLNPTWALATDVVYEQDRGARLRGTRITADAPPASLDHSLPSSWRVSLAPAVEYHWNDRAGLIAGALVSLKGRDSAAVFSPQVAVNMVF